MTSYPHVVFAAGTSSDYVCSGVYHGSHPFSEIETLTVATHLRTIPIAAFITLHSYAQYWLYPYGYKSQKSLDHPELVGEAAVVKNIFS